MSSSVNWPQSVLLGALQGLTEFLPVSSSGHLVLGQFALGLTEPEVLFDVLLHVGTLVAVLVYYGADVWRILRAWALRYPAHSAAADPVAVKTGWLIILGTLPAVIVGGLFNRAIEAAFTSIRLVGFSLLFTGAVLFVSSGRAAGRRGEAEMTWRDALLIGLLQALAIAPGISRSGVTIATALLIGIEREHAARFSFLLAVPAILGALVLKSRGLAAVPAGSLGPFLLGMGIAAATGLLALGWLMRFVRRGNLRGFAFYCWAVGAAALLRI